MKNLIYNLLRTFSRDEVEGVRKILSKLKNVFAVKDQALERTSTGIKIPILQPSQRHHWRNRNICPELYHTYYKKAYRAFYESPVIIVAKKDGDLRFWLDYENWMTSRKRTVTRYPSSTMQLTCYLRYVVSIRSSVVFYFKLEDWLLLVGWTTPRKYVFWYPAGYFN